MNRERLASEKGVTLVHMSVVLGFLLLSSGLAVDSGRSYIVKAQLTKAVDGAALGAARMLNSGQPEDEAEKIFKANFPLGYMGTSAVTDPTTDTAFFKLVTDPTTGQNIVTVTATAELPTTFMTLGNFTKVTVSSSGEATRRMVDLCLALDVSSSIAGGWPAVRDAARSFVDAFDPKNDRFGLVRYSNGATVPNPTWAGRGFDKVSVKANIPNSLPGGSTNMVEGLYRCWDELRAVASGQQSGLRVLVLFTDGASNSVPGLYPGQTTVRSLRTYDFPKNLPDPASQTWDNPLIVGMFDPQSGTQSPSYSGAFSCASGPSCSTGTLMQVPWMPATTSHVNHRSAGIPTSFPLQTASLDVNGAPQSSKRGLRNWNTAASAYPADVFNINNAARNVLEIIASEARNDDGDYKIRIYTIGMGELVRYKLGTMPEMPEDILKRIANDKTSPDFNADQLEGKYYFAETASDVAPAFAALQNQIIRLSK